MSLVILLIRRIREAVTQKIPNILIIGGNEVEEGTVTLRRYCVKEQITLSKEDLFKRFNKLVSQRLMDNFADTEI